jgi:hypothetical protein
VAFAGCGGGGAKRYDDVRKGATLLPPDIALEFLQGIRSRAGGSILGGERNIPPCVFASKGASSNGEYKRLVGRRGAAEMTTHGEWIVHKIEEPSGHDFSPADLDKASAWNYYVRTPRNARTPMGTRDHCVVGPTSEPVSKVLQALSAIGIEIAPGFAFILPKR